MKVSGISSQTERDGDLPYAACAGFTIITNDQKTQVEALVTRIPLPAVREFYDTHRALHRGPEPSSSTTPATSDVSENAAGCTKRGGET